LLLGRRVTLDGVKLSDRALLGVVVAACVLAAAGAAYATSKLTASGLKPGYVGARAPRI
jgi:hypothetical protein